MRITAWAPMAQAKVHPTNSGILLKNRLLFDKLDWSKKGAIRAGVQVRLIWPGV